MWECGESAQAKCATRRQLKVHVHQQQAEHPSPVVASGYVGVIYIRTELFINREVDSFFKQHIEL